MQKLNIAVGGSRHDKRWQNRQLTWASFVARISKTHRTAETVAEYAAAKKARQDEIKDIGGFVGGYLSGGRRLATAVTSRSIITLDADSAEPDMWQSFCLMYGCAAALYSTHKHTPDAPRFRLIVPLSREVLCDEYQAIARRIAEHVGIEQFDRTGYQPHRLMYWPSTSKDGQFVFEQQEGEALDVDAVLATYRDWQDVSEWPRGAKERELVKHEAKRQGDPAQKPGLIGAFCRAYTIREAMEVFLPGVYEPCAWDDRMTFAEGSTSAGVVLYNDVFSYSHHATDPTGGQLCNAFDLVRLHRFGLMDGEATEDMPVNKRPSYVAMCDLAGADPMVRQTLGEERLAAAQEAFGDLPDIGEDDAGNRGAAGEAAEPDSLEWLSELDMDRKGVYLATINNVALIMEHDPVFKGNIAFDEFKQQPVFRRNVPWRKVAGRWSIGENDIAHIENYLEKVYQISSNAKVLKGMMVAGDKRSFHPVRDYLSGLVWDGCSRVDGLLVRYLGAADNAYTRTVTRKTLVACVARVMEPGAKFDYVLTLVGSEGQGKSALWDRLGGRWFSDTFNMHMLQSKEAYEQIQGVWIVEIGELAGMAKVEVERVKGFVSARQDNYRTPYGRVTEQRLRQCVFVASTNKTDFLKSQTGNRRFWPVPTHANPPEESVYNLTQADIDQVWAEAVHLYRGGETLHLTEEMSAVAKAIQEDFTEANPIQAQVDDYLEKLIPENWYELSKWDKMALLDEYHTIKKGGWMPRDKVCKFEIAELVLGLRQPIRGTDWAQIEAAILKNGFFERSNLALRFGPHYPRHRGGFKRKTSFSGTFSDECTTKCTN